MGERVSLSPAAYADELRYRILERLGMMECGEPTEEEKRWAAAQAKRDMENHFVYEHVPGNEL